MDYRMGVIIGLLISIVFFGVLIFVFLKTTKTDGSMKCKYDERQQLVRGRGFKYAFFTMVIYNFILGFLAFMEIQYGDMGTEMINGILAGCVVYVVYCVWNDGYFSMNENMPRILVVLGLIGLMNIILGILSILQGKIMENGILTIRSTNLSCGLMILVLFIVVAIKHVRSKNEGE